MNSALSPREIQARLRAGASVPEVAAAAGVEVARIEGFALPVMAERAHVTRTALASTVRRRGDGSGHRRLGEIAHERLQARGLDADTVEWDAWRQNDLKWRVVGLLDDQAAPRAAEFVFDPKGRFSVADNADARWMIGETPPGTQTDADNENTIDFNDELALVRVISGASPSGATGRPGDDVPTQRSAYQGAGHTSELDELYDMLSGVSEDSVRIYLGLDDEERPEPDRDAPDENIEPTDEDSNTSMTSPPSSIDMDDPAETVAEELSEHPDLLQEPDGDTPQDGSTDVSGASTSSDSPANDAAEDETGNSTIPAPSTVDQQVAASAPEESGDASTSPSGSDGTDVSSTDTVEEVSSGPTPVTPQQDPLVPEDAPPAFKRRPAKKRASIPSWDEIMFGGPPRG